MINSWVIQGNMTKDPETRTTTSGKNVTSFTLAVNKFKDGCDFIPCVAWEQVGDTIARNTSKGSQLAVSGRGQSRQFEDKNGIKRTIIELVVDEFAFCGKKEQKEAATQSVDIDFEEVGDDWL